jgi:hypothetical protein
MIQQPSSMENGKLQYANLKGTGCFITWAKKTTFGVKVQGKLGEIIMCYGMSIIV